MYRLSYFKPDTEQGGDTFTWEVKWSRKQADRRAKSLLRRKVTDRVEIQEVNVIPVGQPSFTVTA